MAAAVGKAKVAAIQAALKGRLINGLITDEATASAILRIATSAAVRAVGRFSAVGHRRPAGAGIADFAHRAFRRSSTYRCGTSNLRLTSFKRCEHNPTHGHMLNAKNREDTVKLSLAPCWARFPCWAQPPRSPRPP